MFEQSFSAENYLTIFNEENRKGHIAFDTMPEEYRKIGSEIKDLKDKETYITKKKIANRTEDEIVKLKNFRSDIKAKYDDRDKELMAELNEYANIANSKGFTFPISNYIESEKQIFSIDTTDWAYFYAIKNLQRSLKVLFNAKQANKHQIMSNVKLLLNTTRPIYIVRTDISGFFESIPQKPLLKIIDRNNLVNNKTKGMIRGILREFNKQKDPARIKLDCGVPRGIGISSYLSEIYMHDIDEQVKNREEVIFYVRYVDDIFMIIAGLPGKQTIFEYYKKLKVLFCKYGLKLKDNNPSSQKCKLINFYCSSTKEQLTYLGYKITLSKPGRAIEVRFNMSDSKFERIQNKIDAAFVHFQNLSKVDIKQAKKDLLDSLNLISGNYRLCQSKERVKVGLYYSNDLLTDFEDLDKLTTYLKEKSVSPYSEVLKESCARDKYISNIERQIHDIDFKKRWDKRTMFKFNSKRLNKICKWL